VQFSWKYESLRITAETITSEVGISFAAVLQTLPSFQVAGYWANFVLFFSNPSPSFYLCSSILTSSSLPVSPI
jgi:hypothetical protein